ncbi:site-2 protease family protein [Candidatus Shapirobacteria bacterium CG09_land_8_20_14_0_10_38_17]|uniref:Site-2 protease family protein n=1 Tax=Candidatus Shapirobacteria bacterium CG09_land_8_20_14_0_10_38_17 TaxID=1974884 RepID=A0A2H0WRR5_9BACT|nr:MAG: site-2 protease family protein [Candidatus Shapirobacteria bacterium CG09_land_8_20_14_0_10_38_17]
MADPPKRREIFSMLSYLFINPFSFFIRFVALLTAISIHEASHAWIANRLGDPTARLAGRITLNPLSHLDPLGTLMLLLIGFGWGKPVPFDPYNLRHPRRDSALISLSGPASNLILAIIISLLWRLISHFSPLSYSTLTLVLNPFIQLNIALGIFNLIPLHPLDGGKILIGLLPQEKAYNVEEFLNRYSLIIFILLLLPFFQGYSLLSLIISPLISGFQILLIPMSNSV